VEFSIDQWVRLAGSVLSSAVHAPVIVTPPAAQTSRLRHLDMVRIGDERIILVVVLMSGSVRQQALRLEAQLSAETLADLVVDWNELFAGRSAGEIQSATIEIPFGFLHQSLVKLLEEVDREGVFGGGDVRIDGLSYMAGEPEFGTGERFQPVVEALERQGLLGLLIEPLLRSEGVFVAIGQEQPIERLRDCAVVLARYGQPGAALGVIGVIGPTRMAYWRAVPMVSYVAAMLNRLLERTYLG
jgi:heat-inducible transcriptional repressor